MTKTLIALSVTLLLGGCSMAPDYQRPELPQGATWQNNQTGEAAVSSWRQQFLDPALQQLIATALENNRDLRIAALNVEAYEARYRIQRAAQLPTLAANGSGTRQQGSDDLSSTGQGTISSQYGANIGITAYELDLFGRIQSLKDQALETYLAQIETQRSTQIALVASVANAYLTLLADQELLALSEATLATEQESYGLTEHKYRLGAASEMELAQGRTALESAKVSLAQYQRQVKQDRNGLALLLGTSVPALMTEPATLAEVQLAAIPVGAPSSLLQQRPDILAAEHSLKAANANIGAARAAFFPTISLTAMAGTASNQLSGLFDGGTGTWTFMPQINLPIFDGGKRIADLDVAEVSTRQAVASYEKSIQTAFKEVADTLGAQTDYQQQLQAQQELVKASQTYFKLAEVRYEKGVDSYLTRLDAQRSLFSAKQGLITTRLAQLSNQVALYKAVGGGWQAADGEGGKGKS
ncbi:efflux transporter outer membrane subunit [Aeromonas dhakensis]|uniref:efflux transporter outer membrane subunit n=1 Tax=Aeromonas dhakensis TaxID=196024 RepID=UPI00259D4783|nr:efflux transporter outer membrane subunit [Aeromonas dhakensis]MDM5053144.1 efflux transporter outer membrane subunit [Aeromonas dhakensis]MDM5078963.1 efflux transporter outer membrane subunit [Aeromonas dhakensis]HDZ8827770.1 efflux transporter outer membrane subunit [Aeromonas dhakensis]